MAKFDNDSKYLASFPADLHRNYRAQRTFYVAADAIGASDENNGHYASDQGNGNGPWQTITVAIERVQPGDTVLVGSGDYRGEDSGWGRGVIGIKNKGARDKPIKIRAAARQRPIVASIVLANCESIEVSGLVFTNPQFELPPRWQDMPAVLTDKAGGRLDILWDEEWSTRSEKVDRKFSTMGRFVTQLEYATAIDIRASVNVLARENTISGYWSGIQCSDGSTGVTIEANDISYCVNGIYTWRPRPSLTDSIIRGNRLRQCFENGIDVREAPVRVAIEANTISYSGFNHINLMSGAEDCVIRGNTVRYGGYYSERMKYPGSSAISVHSSRNGNIMECNLVTYQVDKTGGDGNGMIVDLMKDGAGVVVRNNVAYRNVGAGLNTTASPNCVIANNAFVENGFGASQRRRGAGVKLSRDRDIQQTIVNNIFCDNRAAGILMDKTLHTQKQIDHNLYFSTALQPFIWDGDGLAERQFGTLADVLKQTPNAWNMPALIMPWRPSESPT